MPEVDHHVRRSGDDYAEAWAALLPSGAAWPRDPDSVLMRLLQGQAQVWGDTVDARAADLLETESDPRSTNELLAEWERAFGLPAKCVTAPQTLQARRANLVAKITAEGGQSRPFFYGLAMRLGYVIRIQEYSPVMCGVSRIGDTRRTGTYGEPYRWVLGAPEMRFTWKVRIFGRAVTRFRCGVHRCGVDPLVRIDRATDLECLFDDYKPAHTRIVYDYGNRTRRYTQYTPFQCGVNRCGTDPLLTIDYRGGDPIPPESIPLY